MSRRAHPKKEVIFITDPEIIRQVKAEQSRTGDSSMARTAGRIIDRYIAMRDGAAQTGATAQAAAT